MPYISVLKDVVSTPKEGKIRSSSLQGKAGPRFTAQETEVVQDGAVFAKYDLRVLLSDLGSERQPPEDPRALGGAAFPPVLPRQIKGVPGQEGQQLITTGHWFSMLKRPGMLHFVDNQIFKFVLELLSKHLNLLG